MKGPSPDSDLRRKIRRTSSELIRCSASVLARAQIEAVGAAGRKSADRIAQTFEPRWQELERLSCETVCAAAPNFGSGCTWLIKSTGGGVDVVNTSNAANPLRDGPTPLMTVDVWEHAYYIDYRNARPKHLEEIWKIMNWDFIASNFG